MKKMSDALISSTLKLFTSCRFLIQLFKFESKRIVTHGKNCRKNSKCRGKTEKGPYVVRTLQRDQRVFQRY